MILECFMENNKILENRQLFINELRTIRFDGADIEGLIQYLDDNGFFFAPLSSKYAYSYEGGLCEYSILLFLNLKNICDYNYYGYRKDTVKILGLLANVYKMKLFRKGVRNKKVYDIQGSKRDEIGAFDWVSTVEYEYVPANERTTFGNQSFNSILMIESFIPLTSEEKSCIINKDSDRNAIDGSEVESVMSQIPMLAMLKSAELVTLYGVSK